MSPADEYIKKASECLALCRRAPDQKDRVFLIDLAARWKALAESIWRTEELVAIVGKPGGTQGSPAKEEQLQVQSQKEASRAVGGP
jgi:hypothetical protein